MLVSIVGICLALVAATTALLHCPNQCHCDDEKLDVNCEEGHLDVLPIALNPSIERLVIKNNKIRTIDSSIHFYSELTLLDLSFNMLFAIPEKTFQHQRKLQQLHLNHNKIGNVFNRTFIGLGELAVLNLRGNLVDQVENGTFLTLPKLEELNLGQNRISRIASGAFEGLIYLKILYLDDNILTTIPSPAFKPLPKLAELYLGINSFFHVADDSFSSLPELSKLDLHGTLLSNLSVAAFRGIEQIKVLNLADNRFHSIPTDILANLTRLEELSLGQGEYDVIPTHSFAGLFHLKRIELTGTPKLHRIESKAFSKNPNLKSIIITSNKGLQTIDESAFFGLAFLRHVNLRGNGLTTIHESWFTWNELDSLDLSENPIDCSCSTARLIQNLYVSNRLNLLNNSFCATPLTLQGLPLTELSFDLLTCTYLAGRSNDLVGIALVISAAIFTAIFLVAFRFRHRVRDALKRSWLGKNVAAEFPRQYHKTSSEEDFLPRQSNFYSYNIHSTLSFYPPYVEPTPIRPPLPVTEL